MTKKESILEHNQLSKFKHLRFEIDNEAHIVSLVDADGFEILRGYGSSILEAMNDMHHNLI